MRTLTTIICASVGLLAIQGRALAGPIPIGCNGVVFNLVANCGFETGDFTSWTLTGNDVPMELGNLYGVEGTDPLDGIAPHGGFDQAYFGDLVSNATTLAQTVEQTKPGDTYSISFFLAQDTAPGADGTNTLNVLFDDVLLAHLTEIPVEGYTQYSYTGLASGTSTVLALRLGNSLGEFLLDDVEVVDMGVAVTTTPEPATGLLLVASGLMAWCIRRGMRTP